MADYPSFLTSGEQARLIPVAADTSREARATSILLATVASVPPLARSLLKGVGQKVGKRTRIDSYTEPVFEKCPSELKHRPDGLLLLDSGKRSWSALFETKIGRSTLNSEQIARYCELARLNGINALITVSNQFTALPSHHPAPPPKNLTRSIDLFHWSWMHILTEAMLLLNDHDFESPDQAFILREMTRYFRHDKIGVSTFDRMNRDWKDLVLKIQAATPLKKTNPEVAGAVGAWHQETRDLALLMSRKLNRHVSLKVSRAHDDDPIARHKDDCEKLIRDKCLEAIFDVPDAAAPISVCADLSRRTLTCSMRLAAPKNKKGAKSRINWLVRQLSKTEADGLFVKAVWPGPRNNTQARLADVRNDPGVLISEKGKKVPGSLEVIMVRDLAGKFSKSRRFVQRLETAVPEFYEQVGEHLRAWVPPPPKMRKDEAEKDRGEGPAVQTTTDDGTEGTARGPVAPSDEQREAPPAAALRPWESR